MLEDKLFIEGVNYYQFAAVVEDEILTQTFPALTGQPVTLSSRRTFTPSETANRLEIGVDGDFIHPITLDCNYDAYRPVFEKLLDYVQLFWGITQPAPVQSPPPEPARTEEPDASSQPAKKVDRSMNLGTARAVAEAKLHMTERGLTKTAACELAGIDPRTYNRWCDHEAVDNMVETMRDRPPD
jgi:hypothetical protein